jgi:hypothetical protein
LCPRIDQAAGRDIYLPDEPLLPLLPVFCGVPIRFERPFHAVSDRKQRSVTARFGELALVSTKGQPSVPAKSRLPSRKGARSSAPRGTEHWFAIVALLCIAFLAFVSGSFAMYRNIFPADTLRRAFLGGDALYDRLVNYRDPTRTDFWQPARTDARGVVRYDPVKAQRGLTLYSSTHDQRAFLIDMNGNVVHQWALPYSRIWDKSAAVAAPMPAPYIYIEKAHVFPNGDLLALYTAIGDTPWGYGLVKMDRDSHVIWKYLAHTHHDFDIDAEGNIYVLTQEIAETDLPGFDSLRKPRIDDFVVKLSPDGRELKKVRLIGAVARSAFARRLYFVPWDVHQSSGDYLHTNSVQVLEQSVPGIPQSQPGQVLISLRELNTVALIDLSSQTIVWALSGSWLRQHDARFLPNGHLMLFDNEGNPNGYGHSRVLEIDPATYQVEWSYGGRQDQPLDSTIRSSGTRLENGNTLIVESMGGRVLEVTPGGEIVWEFVNPVRGGPKEDRIPIIFWVERLDPQRDFTLEFRDSLGPVE